jgi:alpha-tubulin suppressor-like RCC1 family protein
MIGCNQQKVVDGSEQRDQLNGIGSQVLFSLDPSESFSNNFNTSLVGLNTKLGTKIALFTDSQCQVELETKSVSSNLTRFNLTFFMEQTVHFYFKVEDIDFKKSNCLDTKITYTIDITPPLGPLSVSVFTTVDNNPRPPISIFGVDSGDKVSIYTESTCAHKIGSKVATGSSIYLVPTNDLPYEGVFNFHYKIEDQTGNEKFQGPNTCIDALSSYTFDQTSPLIPSSIVFNGNQPIDNETIINIDFENAEDDLEATLYSNSNCTIGGYTSGYSVANTLNSSFNFAPYISGQTYNIYYKLRDRAGNYLYVGNSNCINSQLNYHYDIGSPITPVLTNKTTKAILINSVPTIIDYPIVGERKILSIEASTLEIGTTLKIYPQTSCGGTALITKTISDSKEDFSVTLPAGGSYQLSAQLEDAAGNISSCSNEINYEYKEAKQIAIGLYHTCVNFHDGETYCFGKNDKGQLGNGSLSPFERSPQKVSISADLVSVSTGLNHSCHLDLDGDIWCNGDNQSKQVGLAAGDSYPLPQETEVGGSFIKLASGDRHNCAINSTGDVLCFGSNSNGQVGELISGGTVEVAQTGQLGTITNAQELSLGSAHSCVTTSTEQLYCFGLNSSGQAGDDPANSSFSAPYLLGDFDATFITAGTNTNCLISNLGDSKVKCFGSGQKNKLGNSTQLDSEIPVSISDSSEFIDVSTGNDRTCILNAQKELFCFGNGYTNIEKVQTSIKFDKIEVGHSHDCGIADNGEIFCRGSNSFGQFGNENSSSTTSFSVADFKFNQASLIITEAPNVSINTQSTQLVYDNDLGAYPTKDISIEIKNTGVADATNFTTNISNFSEFSISSDSCSPTVVAGATCNLVFTYAPTEPHPNGKGYQIELGYDDELDSRASAIEMRGYALRTLKDLDFTFEGNPVGSVIAFNDSFSALNANLSEEITKTITIQNNSAGTMNIEQAAFYGSDSIHYKYAPSNVFPGQNGTCTGTILSNTSCTIEITYAPKLASMTLPDFSHQSSLRLLIRQGLLVTTTDFPLKGFSFMQSPGIAPYTQGAIISSLYYLNSFSTALIYQSSQTIQEELVFKNDSSATAKIEQKTFSDPNNQYTIVSDNCINQLVLAQNDTCSIIVQYEPDQVSPVVGHQISITIDYSNNDLPLDTGYTTNVQVGGFARSF